MAKFLIEIEIDFAAEVDDEDVDVAIDDMKDTLQNTFDPENGELDTDSGFPYTITASKVSVVDPES